MINRINEMEWLSTILEVDLPGVGGSPNAAAGGPPMSQPGGPGDPMGQDMQSPADQPNQMTSDPQSMQDISDDPQHPDMPEEQEGDDDFEIWKIKFVKESIKGDPNAQIQSIMSVRDRQLEPPQRKFVEDNLDINFLRQNANIFQASKDIRSLIKKEFDRTNPATSVVHHITETLDKSPMLNEVYVKISGLGGVKGDMHRKFISSLIGGVQVGSGGANEDVVFEETDYSIRLSTRFNSRWGDVNIGRWYLREDDPDRYLKEAEIRRLEGGSPEEKDVLRRRIVLESIADQFKERAFIINVVNQDGTVCHLAWDLGNCLKAAFLDGKLVVRTSGNDNKEAFIDEEGSIITVPHMCVNYIKESGDLDQKGKMGIEEIQFIDYRDGTLYLTAPLDIVKEAAVSLQGMMYKETLWQGNPTDLLRVQRCVPSIPEILLRQC
jgi:hypothetical protein